MLIKRSVRSSICQNFASWVSYTIDWRQNVSNLNGFGPWLRENSDYNCLISCFWSCFKGNFEINSWNDLLINADKASQRFSCVKRVEISCSLFDLHEMSSLSQLSSLLIISSVESSTKLEYKMRNYLSILSASSPGMWLGEGKEGDEKKQDNLFGHGWEI